MSVKHDPPHITLTPKDRETAIEVVQELDAARPESETKEDVCGQLLLDTDNNRNRVKFLFQTQFPCAKS